MLADWLKVFSLYAFTYLTHFPTTHKCDIIARISIKRQQGFDILVLMFIVLACLLAVPIDKLLNRLQRLLYRQYVARTRLTSMKHVLILASTMETAHKSSK